MSDCNSCPRKCKSRETGICQSPNEFAVAKSCLHYWEEPIISGTNGSGTIFFSGCSMTCVFCQNSKISHERFGKIISDEEFLDLFDDLEQKGANNINLVNPTHYAKRLAEVLPKRRTKLPIVYNSGGYDDAECLKRLEGLIDIYLPDFKYFSNETATRYSKCANYTEIAKSAIKEMKRQQDKDIIENGLMKKGVIIRHLILPKKTNEAIEIFKYIKDNYSKECILSVMSQYLPFNDLSAYSEINRRITKREYGKVVNYLIDNNFSNVFLQDNDSADEKFIPDFNLEGLS